MRGQQLMWIVDHFDDVESDMSVFHRVDDVHDLPGPLFFKRAERLPAYRGVLRTRLEAELAAEAQQTAPDAVTADPAAQRYPGSDGAPVPVVPSSVARSHAGFQGDGHQFPPVFGPKPGSGS